MFQVNEFAQSDDGSMWIAGWHSDDICDALAGALEFAKEYSQLCGSWSVSVEFDGHVLFALNSDMGSSNGASLQGD